MRKSNGRFTGEHKKVDGFAKGSKHSQESKDKISQSLKGKYGKESRRWKGDDAGYVAKHLWLVEHFGNAKICENLTCTYENPSRYEWANISGNYTHDRKDYVQLCPSCHRKFDMGLLRLDL